MQYKYLIISILIVAIIALCFCGYMFLFNKEPELAASDLEKELAECEEAIKKNPNDFKAYYNKGHILFELNKYKQSLEAYNRAIKINPDNPDVYNNQGVVFLELNEYELAIKAYDKKQ
ncbi:MAG: tetratricopeptide repeat protein [Janthinobacterium lividum]